MRAEIFALLFVAVTASGELPDISTIPADLTVPAVEDGRPAAGKRVRQTAPGWEGAEVHHTIYLPANWSAEQRWPVIVEYAGNGGYQNRFGDVCDGTVEGSKLGYGLSAGRDYIWVCMPFVQADGRANATLWWGDVEESVRYCLAAVRLVCAELGGDARRVLLCGFSRGAIACNFIGLHNDEIAKLWCGMLCHSHYDGVRAWPYEGADREAAMVRLRRLGRRPQFISHEGGTTQTEAYLKSTRVQGDFTFANFPFRNHTDDWALRPCELRGRAREWLRGITKPGAR